MDARARLLAVEVLLADPESLGNDALETDLCILRDQLRAAPQDATAAAPVASALAAPAPGTRTTQAV
jgi:hypothetical protein